MSSLEERLKAAERAVEQGRKLRHQLLAALTHDLRGPMATILLWEQLLRERSDDADVRRQAVDAIRDAATTQSELIAELIELATTLGEPDEWPRRRIGIDLVVSAALESCLSAARAKQISLTPHYEAPLGAVDAEPARLRHALAKIFDTAVRFAAPSTTLPISGRRVDGTIELAIGAGGDSDKQYERAPLGIGLVSASEILALHGGSLEALRIQRGAPPTYRVTLPLANTRSSRP